MYYLESLTSEIERKAATEQGDCVVSWSVGGVVSRQCAFARLLMMLHWTLMCGIHCKPNDY